MELSTEGCRNCEDLGGNTGDELKYPLSHDKTYLGGAGVPDLAMKKDPGLSAIQGCLLLSAFAVARSAAGRVAVPMPQQHGW